MESQQPSVRIHDCKIAGTYPVIEVSGEVQVAIENVIFEQVDPASDR